MGESFFCIVVDDLCKVVDSETGFLVESFQLASFYFQLAEFGDVPWSGVREGNSFRFTGGELIQTGGEVLL